MRILEKYLFKSFLAPLIYCAATFLFLYVVIDLFGHLDEILRNKVPLSILFDYYLNLMPAIFIQVTPVSVLLATVYTLSAMNKYNEITAMKASGISVFRIIRPFLLMGLLFSVLTILVNERVVPQASMTATVIKQDKLERVEADEPDSEERSRPVIKDVVLYGSQNCMFYAKTFDPAKNTLHDVVILHEDSSRVLEKKITARKAVWEQEGWLFYDCSIYDFEPEDSDDEEYEAMPDFYEIVKLDITETPKDFIRGQFRAEHMDYATLSEYINRLSRVEPKTAKRLSVDLYYKTSFPFITFEKKRLTLLKLLFTA